MKNEDKEAIRRAIEFTKQECTKHERCIKCRLYKKGKGCVIDCPPQFLDAEQIIKCFT